ncbi:MAG: cytochrome c [Proteobacteria bacterium]|nr:cytochrome c [Pseudomonadota bacterium]
MKKLTTLAILLAFCVTLGVTGTVMAEKKHAPKGVWKGMLASLGDIQGITAALTVFDMKRATMFADGLVARERFVSNLERLPKAVRDGHAKVADVAEELAAATRSGDEQEISIKIGAVLAACSACHYNLRDAERRKKLE